MAKNVSKSIRLSDEVYEYISNYRGEGFNEKFENIILDYKKKEKQINDRIKAKEKELKLWSDRVNEVIVKIRKLERMQYQINNCKQYLDTIEKDLKDIFVVSQK
ncbi:MAG: hypothetical protein ACI4AA_10765 [Lachnospiraceae bacterium]